MHEFCLMKSQSAQVHFNDSGTPVADHFDDVYFSNDSGIDETLHVFIGGNDLSERWQSHNRRDFVIAETGFGTALNCLVAMQAFKQFCDANPAHPLKHLFILTTEKFPLKKADLRQALNAFPALNQAADALAEQYPVALQGCHRMHFTDFSCTLDLWMGDVHELLPQWHCPRSGLIDAWFLDGFAPSKNPEMWTDALFLQMARLTRQGGTFGTFTAAGIVKRGLRDAGFVVEKRKGFGRKRDMLAGYFDSEKGKQPAPPYSRYNNAPLGNGERIAIVGGGLAAATFAHALAKQGVASSVFCADETLATGASGNRQGGFYPQLHSEASIASQIQALSFLYARRYYNALPSDDYRHQWCGVLQLGFSDAVIDRQQKLADGGVWPDELVRPVSAKEATAISGLPLSDNGLFIPLGGWLSPPDLVHALIKACGDKVTLHLNAKVHNISESSTGVTFSVNNESYTFDRIIMATGADSVLIDTMNALPLRPVRGQVEAIATQAPIDQLNTVLCHKGYMTPQMDSRHALGSTYGKGDTATDVREVDTQTNLATHQKALSSESWIRELEHDGDARASVRLSLPDHQPASGQLTKVNVLWERYQDLTVGKPIDGQAELPEGRIFTLTGLGSRGLTTAPLMAQVLASQLLHQPMPMPEKLLQAVAPQRFMIRNCIRGEAP